MQGQARVQGQTAQIIGQTGQQQIMKVVASTNQQGKDFSVVGICMVLTMILIGA
jgi:hypothetical protein